MYRENDFDRERRRVEVDAVEVDRSKLETQRVEIDRIDRFYFAGDALRATYLDYEPRVEIVEEPLERIRFRLGFHSFRTERRKSL